MIINDYYKILDAEGMILSHNINSDNCKQRIDSIAYHTSKVGLNTLFICKGASFKKEYALQAVNSGAELLVCEREPEGIGGVAFIAVNDIRKAMSLIAAFHYGYPDRELFTVGITGTKGKTTTAFFVKSIIDEYEKSLCRMPCAIFSSIDNYYGGETEVSHLTTPESPDLYKYMRQAVSSKIDYLVMEASSQGLKYGRVDGMNFSVGAFLNISSDHISPREHTDFNDYFESKLKIFDICSKAVVNLDSEHFDRIKDRLSGREYLTFSLNDKNADVYGYYIKSERDFTLFRVRTKECDREFRISMKGIFNVSNALCAIAIADLFDIPNGCIERGLIKARAEGRMEFFSSPDENINVIVDYAHNKLSFEKLFESVRAEFPQKKIVAVFGCPGFKAYDRRHDLPAVASRFCSYIYITEEDAGEEALDDISNDIAANLPENFPYEIENDRKKAIFSALKRFSDDSVIVITGKGRERTQRRGREYMPVESDVDIVNEYISLYGDTK